MALLSQPCEEEVPGVEPGVGVEDAEAPAGVALDQGPRDGAGAPVTGK